MTLAVAAATPLTLGALATRRWSLFNAHHEEREFLHIGLDLIESEALVDKLYEIYLTLLAKGWAGGRGMVSEFADIGEAYVGGFYVPCVKRVVFTGQVDLRTDGEPPFQAGLVDIEPDHTTDVADGILFSSVRRLDRLPRGVTQPAPGTPYTSMIMFRPTHRNRQERRVDGVNDVLHMNAFQVFVASDGRVKPCVTEYTRSQHTAHCAQLGAFYAATAAKVINASADARYLWNVETAECLLSLGKFKTPLRLGVSPEHVKSLFYARSLPLTETGRRRPILHWVRAHERRLKSGIEIDVKKHLRGITEFEMAGFPFRITSPTKEIRR